jgi:hypothetical protein
MFSVITNFNNKKTKGPTLMELFTATGKQIFFLENYTCWMCDVSPMVHTSNISSSQNTLFSFPVAVNNSITVGPLVFLLQKFVIMENLMKRPVQSEMLVPTSSTAFYVFYTKTENIQSATVI